MKNNSPPNYFTVKAQQIQFLWYEMITIAVQTFIKEALMKSESGTPSRDERCTLEWSSKKREKGLTNVLQHFPLMSKGRRVQRFAYMAGCWHICSFLYSLPWMLRHMLPEWGRLEEPEHRKMYLCEIVEERQHWYLFQVYWSFIVYFSLVQIWLSSGNIIIVFTLRSQLWFFFFFLSN